MNSSTIRASSVGRSRRKPKTYAAGRVCADERCGVRLSRYNRASYCYSHAPARFPRLRGEFTEEYLERSEA
jgi:hypothetical protein